MSQCSGLALYTKRMKWMRKGEVRVSVYILSETTDRILIYIILGVCTISST